MLAPHIPHRIGKKVGSAEKKTACRKKSYSIVWEACLCLRLRHPRSAIPSIASIASIASIVSIVSIALRTPLSDSALNVGAQYFAPAPQCHPARLYSLSFSHQLMRAQNIAPLQEGASLLGSGVAIHGSSASYRRSFFFGEADFFSAKRLFLRAARDVSGEHSEPPWARVEIKLKMSFQALSHSPSHARASALTSPPPDFLFSSIHPKPPSHHPPALLSKNFFGIFGR